MFVLFLVLLYRRGLGTSPLYVDGPPLVAAHCTAKYITMVAEHGACKAMYTPVSGELCTQFLCRMMVNRRTRYISQDTVHFTTIYHDLMQEFPIIMEHNQYIHDLTLVAVHCSAIFIPMNHSL